MHIALPHPSTSAPAHTQAQEGRRKTYRDPDRAIAVAQVVFVLAAEVALMVLLFIA